jgi:flagellar biosynthetic protein FliR
MLTRELTTWLLVFLRIGAMLAVAPVFSTSSFPIQIRLALGAIVAVLVTPLLPMVSMAKLTLWGVVGLAAQETASGLLLGFVCRLAFFAIELAGSIMANDIGLNMASTLNPMINSPMASTTTAVYWMAVGIMFALDLHHAFIVGFQRTYEMLPMGEAHLSDNLLGTLVARTGWVFIGGLQIAAPVMATSFIITLLFALLGRAVPQMNVFAESMPIRVAGGMIVFGMTCSLMGEHIVNFFHHVPEDMLRVALLMGKAAR